MEATEYLILEEEEIILGIIARSITTKEKHTDHREHRIMMFLIIVPLQT
jgi:hypothetical protein